MCWLFAQFKTKMKKLIAANWKMNKTIEESISLVRELKKQVKNYDKAEIVVCPPFTSLNAVSAELKGSGIKLGAQNMHFEDSGAFTGEVSPVMLREIGCEYVIIGHSERREFFHETDDLINKKIFSALRHSLKPILCVGENLEQRNKGIAHKIIEQQIKNCVAGIDKIRFSSVTIAYEPVWAISRGNPNQKSATSDDAEECHLFIRNLLENIFGKKTAGSCRILYGGSMKPDNARELLSMPDIDGGLVGNASLNAENFAAIVNSA